MQTILSSEFQELSFWKTKRKLFSVADPGFGEEGLNHGVKPSYASIGDAFMTYAWSPRVPRYLWNEGALYAISEDLIIRTLQFSAFSSVGIPKSVKNGTGKGGTDYPPPGCMPPFHFTIILRP